MNQYDKLIHLLEKAGLNFCEYPTAFGTGIGVYKDGRKISDVVPSFGYDNRLEYMGPSAFDDNGPLAFDEDGDIMGDVIDGLTAKEALKLFRQDLAREFPQA